MIGFASAVVSGVAALIAVAAWMLGVAKRARQRYLLWRLPPPHLDPNGEDADWKL